MNMSDHQFIVTDIDFQSINKEEEMDGSTIVKSEDVKDENILLFSHDDIGDFGSQSGFPMDECFGNNGNVDRNSALIFNESQVNQILNGNAFTKVPIDFGSAFKTEDIKNERSLSHFIKYRIQDGKQMKFWECAICSKEFGHQYTLMRHLPTHTDERKFQCNTCGKAFRQMSTLSQHRAIHSAERPYVCEICHKTFNRVSTLISHRKTHTGQKPHQCHLCNKAFHQKGNLRNHIFTHTNERPYKCDICSKGFNQMSNLMCHKLKAHQRADKPRYTCQICGKDFQKRMGLRNHEQYQHRINNHESNSFASGPTRINRYSNGILVEPINTAAMQHALATDQTPFALLRPLNGIPVLVRVLAAGEKQMLVPATAEDLKKHGQISITPKTDLNPENLINTEKDPLEQQQSSDTIEKVAEFKPVGSTVQIKIPVVATVVQRYGKDGNMCMAVQSPGPSTEAMNNENYLFTTTTIENIEQNTSQMLEEVAATNENNLLANQIQFVDERGNILNEDDYSHTNTFYQQNFPFASEQEVFNPNMHLENNVLSLEDNQENLPPVFKEIDSDPIMNLSIDNSNMHIYKMLDKPQEITLSDSDSILDPANVLYDGTNLGSDYMIP